MSRKSQYGPGSNLHRHHIVPIHAGGLNESSNYTYLTLREHILAHYLLWRINKDSADINSMRILKGCICPFRNRLVGKNSLEKQKGIFDPKYKKIRSEWGNKGRHTQKLLGVGIHSPESRRKGGLATAGTIAIHKPGDKSFKRVKPERLNEYLESGYIRGRPKSS